MIFQGIRTSVAKKPYNFVMFQEGSRPLPPPPLDPRMVKQPALSSSAKYCKTRKHNKTYTTKRRSYRPDVLNLFSCSTQLSMKFQLLIKTKIPTNKVVPCFKSLRCCIYPTNKCLNANNCWHFNIYEHGKFHAQSSRERQKFYDLEAWSPLVSTIC